MKIKNLFRFSVWFLRERRLYSSNNQVSFVAWGLLVSFAQCMIEQRCLLS